MEKKNNKKQTTFLTLGVTIIVLAVAGVLLTFAFRGMIKKDDAYNPVGDSKEDVVTVAEETVQPQTEDKYHQETTQEQLDLYSTSFETEGITFRLSKASEEPKEGELTAEEAAQIGLDVIKTLTLEDIAEEELTIYLTNVFNSNIRAWCVGSRLDTYAFVVIHPVSGEIMAAVWPHRDDVHNGYTEEGAETPWMSLSDFNSYMRSERWMKLAVKYIRDLKLNGEEIALYFDEKTGIEYGRRGYVEVPIMVGSGENAERIVVYIDMYTEDYIGYMLYDKIYG